jgi:ADP-heptose:LPS heptosyltransferase
MENKKIKIAIVGLREIGSTMMFWPFLWNLNNLINKSNMNISVDYIVKEDRSQGILLEDLKNINLKVFNFGRIKPFNYDLLINPFPFQKFKMRLFNFIYAKKRLTPFTKNSLHFDKKNSNLKLHNYYLLYTQEIANILKIKYKVVDFPKFRINNSNALKKFNFSKNKYVIFSPTSDAKLSSWSEELFNYFYKKSKKEDKLPIVIIGLKKYLDYSDYDLIDLTKQISISEVLQLLYFSKKNYTTETASLHISSHMGKPTIAALSAITPWFLTDDMINVKMFINKKICPYTNCYTKFKISICPYKKRFCLTNAISSLSLAKKIKKRLWKK